MTPLLGNPYYHHPQPAARQVADDVLYHIAHTPSLAPLFEQGKMLGILVVAAPEPSHSARVHILNNIHYLAAYSGVINGLEDPECFFVPPVYDLQQPDDFYLQRDAEITSLNKQLSDLESIPPKDKVQDRQLRQQREQLRQQRKALSIALQKEIFRHFSFLNPAGQYRNIIDLFADAKRGLPPGGSGECAAPRLLQYAYANGLHPLELAEFWYGRSPRTIHRIHGQFYPSCIEKCSPILAWMLPGLRDEQHPAESRAVPYASVSSQPVSAAQPLPAESRAVLNGSVPSHHLSEALTTPPESRAEVLTTPPESRAVQNGSVPPLTEEPHLAAPTLPILYEDAHLLVVVKPKGLLSTPAKDPTAISLEDLLHTTHPEVRGPMLVHRLDQATSGVMLAAKDAQTHKALQHQFLDKTIHKRYLATLSRRISTIRGILSLPLTVNPDDRPRQVIDWQFGKQAITYYEVIHQTVQTSTLALYPLTGRTHQLRVHCASPYGLDAPIVGDTLYDILDAPITTDIKEDSKHSVVKESSNDSAVEDSSKHSATTACQQSAETDTTSKSDKLAPTAASSPIANTQKQRCLQLHAESITFIHPVTQERMTFAAPPPETNGEP